MLEIPRRNFKRSVENNNVGTNELGDWIEASLLFCDKIISKSDIVDILIEQQICDKQDLAHEIAEEGFGELRERKKVAGITDGFLINGNRLYRKIEWKDDPIRAFLVFLSLLKIYPGWAEDVKNSNEQGLIFEQVVEILCLNLFPDWETYRVGWSPQSPVNIENIVHDLCGMLNCSGHRDLDSWISDKSKDGGLDLVCFRPFPDNKEAIPTYFIQCASGSNWRNKIHTPSAEKWKTLLDSAVKPGTGIAAPFVIDDKTLKIKALEGQVIILDRLRLLNSYYKEPDILKNDLRDQIVTWLEPKIELLPVLS